jgi:hypothetical protein
LLGTFGLSLRAPEALADEASAAVESEPPVTPPSPRRPFLQYGVAFTVEGVAAPGPICSDPNAPCILGSGGGIAVRIGWRPTEDLYIGGAYELSKQEPNELYRLGILQQARAEARHYFRTGHRTRPFAMVGGGLAGYGNEWAIDTWGPSLAVGGGVELEVSGGVMFDAALIYRPIYFRSFVDSSTLSHEGGISHFICLELAVEAQEAL